MPNKPKMISTTCTICQREFTTTLSNIKRGRGKFCSFECRYKEKRETFICFFCATEFISIKSRLEKSKTKTYFCSNECKYKGSSSLQCDYRTGPKPKTPIGIRTYRNRALLFLDNKCNRCGYNEHIELVDVDHIDSNRNNNDISNLQILCVMCHAMKTRLPELFSGRPGGI